MLLAWTIPNTAASVVGGAVSLNLSHAFEAAIAGYGLGRILTNQNAAGAGSGVASQGGHSLGASLEAGDRAATANRSAAPPAQNSPLTPGRPQQFSAPQSPDTPRYSWNSQTTRINGDDSSGDTASTARNSVPTGTV